MNDRLEELLPIVSELAEKHTGKESTSVTYERAQSLMDAVLYCLEEQNASGQNTPAQKGCSVREQYQAGLRLLYDKVVSIKELYNQMSVRFEDFGVACLRDTVRKGIPAFLERYDIQFCPQDTILTLDYPVLAGLGTLTGADAVYVYLQAIQKEQQFFSLYDKNYVISLLQAYDSFYQEMTENICGIVLANTLGHIAAKKPLQEPFEEPDDRQLSALICNKDITELKLLVKQWTQTLIATFYDGDQALLQYLFYETDNIAVRLKHAAQYGQLRKMIF